MDASSAGGVAQAPPYRRGHHGVSQRCRMERGSAVDEGKESLFKSGSPRWPQISASGSFSSSFFLLHLTAQPCYSFSASPVGIVDCFHVLIRPRDLTKIHPDT